MPKIIKNNQIVDDAWHLYRLPEGETPLSAHLPDADLIVPLPVWQARREELLERGRAMGVWLDSHEGAEAIEADLSHFAIVALNFPKFVDGRAYSTARLLRERYGYQGELRAVGDVLRDQLYLMKRCGFNAFAVRADKDLDEALAGFSDFTEAYQAAVDQPLPLFRRRAA